MQKPQRTLSKFLSRCRTWFSGISIRYAVFLSFTISAAIAVALTAMLLFLRFSKQIDATILEENTTLVKQLNQSVNTHLRNMIRLSDSLCYSVIKNADMETDSIDSAFQLLYDSNGSYVQNIALFSIDGELIAAAPPAKLRTDLPAIADAPWFVLAREQTENLHFSAPAIQQIFTDAAHQQRWVISLSSAVEMTYGKRTTMGILLIDLKYSSISVLFDNVQLSNNGYVYLVGSDGEILYHPRQNLIAAGIASEDTLSATVDSPDGVYQLSQNGNKTVLIRSVGYTGWKLVGVVPQKGLSLDSLQNTLFILLICLLSIEVLVLINAIISRSLINPVNRLEQSVQELDYATASADAIYTGGSYEVRSLGASVRQMIEKMHELTERSVREHEEKRRSELNALQSQINPHFLYNTLDIIVWMIEKGQPGEAVKIVTALGRFFRISLSHGKNIIPVANELAHVDNYLTIQQMRYKNKFTYQIDAEPEVMQLATIKLVVQPIVENAIYHSMDFMDGDGEILIGAHIIDGELHISICDNGLGMAPERVATLLTSGQKIGKGSGIGLKNVHDRIRLYFGEEYGLTIHSELDEGTTVLLRLPAVPFADYKEEER